MKFKVGDRVRSETFPSFPAGTVIRTRERQGGQAASVWIRWDEGYDEHRVEVGLMLEGGER